MSGAGLLALACRAPEARAARCNPRMDTSVHVEHDGPVTIVTLDRPQVRNAVDGDTALQLQDAFLRFDDDADARVAVFHGARGHFCAGWDLQFCA